MLPHTGLKWRWRVLELCRCWRPEFLSASLLPPHHLFCLVFAGFFRLESAALVRWLCWSPAPPPILKWPENSSGGGLLPDRCTTGFCFGSPLILLTDQCVCVRERSRELPVTGCSAKVSWPKRTKCLVRNPEDGFCPSSGSISRVAAVVWQSALAFVGG